ncbi:hypothetical protein V2J09_023786 [Rumex salicifolius]
MADVPRSISLSKKLSNVGELSSKHFYDGVFSAPTATKRDPSTFSIRIDDYREIFTPSNASLGFSIPILDLPAVDRSDLIGSGRSSCIDYAGVFGGLGDDDRIGVPAEVIFRESKKKAKIDSHPSRSSMPTEITDSRSPEIFRDSGNRQPSKSPTKTRMAASKGQEVYSSITDNPVPSQVSESSRKTGTAVSKGQEFSGGSQASRSPTKTEMAIPTSSRSSKTPTKARMTHSISLELHGSSRDNGASSDGFKHVNVPYQEKASDMSMDGTYLSMHVNKGRRQGKQTRSVSDLGKVKQSIDYDDIKEFSATQNTREANGSEQSVSPKLFGSNDYFRKSSSQRSKSFTKSQQSSGSTSPLLELDVNSTAAESAAAMKRAIEEAEAKIHWAKEFLKGKEFDGSTKLSFKSSLRAKAASNNTYHSYDSFGLNQTGTLEDEARRENEFVDEDELMKPKGDLDFTTSESQLPDEQEDTSLLVCVNDARFVEKENSPEAVKSTEKSYKDDGGGGEWETAKHISQLISGVKNRFVSFISKQADTEKIAVYDVQDDVEKDILGRFSFKQADTENTVIQEDAPTSNGSVEHQSEGSSCQDQVEKDVQVNFDASSGVGEIIQDSNKGMKIHMPGENDIVFPDVEMLSGQHCDQSEAEGESEVQESVQGQSEEISDDCATLEHKKDRVDTDGCEENDMAQETMCQSGVCDLKKETICKDNNETQKEVQDLEVVENGVDLSFDCKDGTRRQEEGCSWREVEMPKDSEKKIGDFQMVEETCTNEFQEREQASELFLREDDERGEHRDAKSILIEGVTGVVDETTEHDEQKLEDARMVEEVCTDELQETVHASELFRRKVNKTVECRDVKGKSVVGNTEVTYDTFEHDKKKLEDAQMVEEVCTDEQQETVQVSKLFTKEDNKTIEYQDVKEKSTVGVIEITDDTSKHVEKKLEDALMVEEVCTDELQEIVQVAKLFAREDNKIVEYQNVKGKSTIGITKVTNDTSKVDEKKLEDAQRVEEICTDELQETIQIAKLFTIKDNKTVEYKDVKGKLTLGITEVTDDTSEHVEMKLEDAHMVEETCTNELQETVQAAKFFAREDNKTDEYQDVKGKSTVGVTEITDDTFEHDEKKLENAQMVEETCIDELQETAQVEKLFTRNDNKTNVKGKSIVGVSEVTDETSEHDEMKLEDAHMVEETCTDELQETVQVAKFFIREDNKRVEYQDIKCKSTVGVSEVTNDTFEHDEKKLEDAQIVEETFTDELQKTVQVEKLFTREDYKTVEYQDVKGKSIVGVSEVTGDTSEHDEMKLEDAHMVEETCTDELQETVQVAKLLTREDQKTVEYQDIKGKSTVSVSEVTNDTFEHDEKKLEDAQMVEETCTKAVQVEKLFTREDYNTVEYQDVKGKSTICVAEVTDDTSEHDEMKLEDAQKVAETSTYKLQDTVPVVHYSTMRNKDARVCDTTDQCPQDVESTNLDHEDECPPPVDESLDHEEKCLPLADETLDHEDEAPLPKNVCRNEVHSCLTGKNEGYKHDDKDGHSLDMKFSREDEKMIESIVTNSFQSELNTEQPNTIQTDTKLIGEDIVETSVSARDLEDFIVVKEETENKREVYPHTSCQKIHCETDVEFEQECASEEIFATDLNSENQGDEVVFITDLGEVDRMHDAEISYKRKRWFENRVEADEFHQSGILLGDKITLDLDQEITQGSTVDDEVEIKGDGRVKESGNCTNVRPTDACNSVEGGCRITEAYHQRRRWFEDREKEVLHKTPVFDGAGTTTQMDDLIAQESELLNEGKNGTDAKEDDLTSDQVESKATAEAAHRRRRWFESREKLEPIQIPSILEDIGITPNQEENTVKPDDIGETSTESIMKRNHRNQLKKEKRERKAVQRAIREARERAFLDARERAAVEARQKAASQDMQGKNPSEPKSGSGIKSSMDAKLREERAAVERATSEARERAMQKAMSDKAASMSKEKDFKNQTSGPSSSGYSSETFSFEKSSGVVSESPRRRRAISERHKRTMERAAKALEEKNMRDYLAQKEQAERNSLADALDADIKSWLTGKDSNLRAMLSTLQYILGPDSGWQPIPLIDLMTSTAVRKAYKRAALCVHPDKLQQRGATIQQKYICEKVFDLLKDAWHKFNPDDW